MKHVVLAGLVFLSALQAADDGWAKVKELKSGTEIKLYQKGARQPLQARLDDAADDKIIISVKNEQRAVEKSDIDRLDARPAQTGSRITRETKTGTTTGNEPRIEGVPSRPNIPQQTQSSSVSFGSKADFETIYRRTPGTK